VLLLWCTLLHAFFLQLSFWVANPLWGTTTSCGTCVVWVVWGYVVGGTLVSGTTQQSTLNTKKYCIYTMLYYTQCKHCSISNTQWYLLNWTQKGSALHTGTHVVHNNYSGTQHSNRCTTHTRHRNILATWTSIASIMISVLILSSTLTSRSVVVRDGKKHYVDVKTEPTLSTLWPRK